MPSGIPVEEHLDHFFSQGILWLLQYDFIRVLEQVLCYRSSVYITLFLLLEVQVEYGRYYVGCLLASCNGRF